MKGAHRLASALVAVALVLPAGCVRWARISPADLQIHGKAGLACSAAVTPLVWSVNMVLFPVSVASLGQEPPSHDNLGYPGLVVENAAYFSCATLGLPFHALGWGAERMFSRLVGREALEDYLIGRLPELSVEDYALLLRTARRTCPPRYDSEVTQTSSTAPPRQFGLWSAEQAPRFGSKPRLGNLLAAAEWRDWRTAGRPRDEEAETAFIIGRALRFPDPIVEFAATYGFEHQELFAREVAAQRTRVEALGVAGDAPELLTALRDPSPLVRAAAVGLTARSRRGGAAGELARLLEDPAVMVRVAAADALAALADPAGVAPLGRALHDPDTLVRERAALALGRVGSAAAAALLLGSLESIGHRARFEVLCALAAAGTPGAKNALARALSDRDLHTRLAAAAAIGRTATDPVDPLLVSTLADADPRIAGAAAAARARRGPPGTLDERVRDMD